MGAATISVDEFMALEQKVLQTVELIKKEREARNAADAARMAAETAKSALEAELSVAQQESEMLKQEIAVLKQELSSSGAAHEEIAVLHQERASVRLRVETMLSQLDELL